MKKNPYLYKEQQLFNKYNKLLKYNKFIEINYIDIFAYNNFLNNCNRK